ncbi:MAG: class II fructose-bisphosphate aldolase [Caldilineaceae bacterium]
MIHESVYELRRAVQGVLHVAQGRVEVVDEAALRAGVIDQLIRDAVFGGEHVRNYARWLIWEAGQTLGARPASIHEFYIARGQDKWADRTVPAMNIRFTTYDTTRAALRAAQRTNTGAMIFEIARSEMSYTEQEPAEYSAAIIAAAIKEGYYHPLFIQGDHFQVKGSKYKSDPEGAVQEVKDLIAKSIPAGFWNIDIDTSTLVTLEPSTLEEQQYHNFTRSAELTQYVRSLEPAGVTVSLGGEIGEVGEKNSTPEELDAYIVGYEKALKAGGNSVAGLSKISVQTGTSHGGVVLPDGSMATVAVDFDTLAILGERARQHGSGGAVQHGASTLPEELFNRFPEVQTLEIHLATGFMNLFMDHPAFPAELKQQMQTFMDKTSSGERKATDSDAQFYYKTRKKVLGPYKPEMWGLTGPAKDELFAALEKQFEFFYNKLNVTNTRELIDELVTVVEYHLPAPKSARGVGDDLGLSD